MRKWMRDRMKRRNKAGGNAPASNEQDQQQPTPLQPTFLDREAGDWAPEGGSAPRESRAAEPRPEPVYEAQPEQDPTDGEQEPAQAEKSSRRDRSRRRGRGGRSRKGKQQGQPSETATPVAPIKPGLPTGEAAEVDAAIPDGEADATPAPAPSRRKEKAPRGAVVLAIGLPGSGKSSWFRRHNLIPLSSDLVRGLLFDDATEQRHQDLVFSTLRYMLRMRLVAGRPMNYIDATNLSPKERHSWIKMAKDFGYEAHAVFFDVPAEICMERNRRRSRNVPDDVMIRMANKLRPPKFEEGFGKITIVRLRKQEPRAEEPIAEPEE
ncbi:MAG TPA: AAA family ATPase [Clostridia bacterium]|nr:AAA family ATPase [Clostridia bacterium]